MKMFREPRVEGIRYARFLLRMAEDYKAKKGAGNTWETQKLLRQIRGVYQAHIPSYPSGHWLFGFASKKYHPLDDLDKVGWKLKGIHTKYYEPRLHAGVFALPAYVEALLEDVER